MSAGVGWWADGFHPVGETLRPGRSRSPTPGGRDRFASPHVRGLGESGVRSSVHYLCVLADYAVPVQYDMEDYLKRGGRNASTAYTGEERNETINLVVRRTYQNHAGDAEARNRTAEPAGK